jgi:hypothetical protein
LRERSFPKPSGGADPNLQSYRRCLMKKLRAAAIAMTFAASAGAAPPNGVDPDSPLAQWYRSPHTPDTGLSCCSVADLPPGRSSASRRSLGSSNRRRLGGGASAARVEAAKYGWAPDRLSLFGNNSMFCAAPRCLRKAS